MLRKAMYVFLGLVLMATMAMSVTVSAKAVEGESVSPPAWMFEAKLPTYFASQFTTSLVASDVSPCPGEPVGSCWKARAQRSVVVDGETALAFVQFAFNNRTTCRMDGYYLDPTTGEMTTGIPEGKDYWTEGLTYRPHECDGATKVTTATATTYPLKAWTINDGYRSKVRQSASISATVVALLDPSTPVTLTAKTGVWYQMESGFIHEIRVQFTEPVTTATATTSATPPCVTAPATVKWTKTGSNEWTWNTYADSDGQPVEMTLATKQDGEYVDSSGAHSPIPAGTYKVTGITARCD